MTDLDSRLKSAAVMSGVDFIVRLVAARRRVTCHHVTMVKSNFTRVMVTPDIVSLVMSPVVTQLVVRSPVPYKSVFVWYLQWRQLINRYQQPAITQKTSWYHD